MTRPRRREFVWIATALILALWYSVGGDRPEDRLLTPLARPVPLPYVAPALGLQRFEDCPRLRRGIAGREWLRHQLAHKSDTQPVRVECAYGPAYPRGGI
jgi:hypothetical protein